MKNLSLSPFIPSKYRRPVKKSNIESSVSKSTSKTSSKHKPLIIGPSNDPVYSFLFTETPSLFHFLNLEDLGRSWSISCSSNDFLTIKHNNKKIQFSGVYFRAGEYDDDYPHKNTYEILFRKLDYAKFPVLGARKYCFNNISKPLQLKKIVPFCTQKIKIPETLLIKIKISSKSLQKKTGASIVKATSSLRCQVTDNKTFATFNTSSIKVIPSMFQKKLYPTRELRVHLINNKFFPLEIKSMGSVDYRYSDTATYSEELQLNKDLKSFCKSVQKNEKNPLVGIDIIESNNDYYVLEANPNPGWAAFSYSNETKKKIALEIYNYLGGKVL